MRAPGGGAVGAVRGPGQGGEARRRAAAGTPGVAHPRARRDERYGPGARSRGRDVGGDGQDAVRAPAPAAALHGEAPAKTVPSKAMPDRVGGGTMGLDPTHQRPTPSLPFAGSNGSVGVGYVGDSGRPEIRGARAELGPIWCRGRLTRCAGTEVPTEAAFRTLEEHWRHPARRAEFESAVTSSWPGFAAGWSGRGRGRAAGALPLLSLVRARVRGARKGGAHICAGRREGALVRAGRPAREAGAGGRVPPEIASRLPEQLRQSKLTPRELRVLQMIAEGKSNKEIGNGLGIVEGTVKVHVTNLLSKLHAVDRTQAVTTAIKRGILDVR